MAAKAAKFHEMIDKFYKSGLLKEVYSSEHTKVCNAFNQYYVAFNLDMLEEYSDQFPGFKMETSVLQQIVQDDGYLMEYYSELSPKSRKAITLPLDQRLFDYWSAHKQEFSQLPANPALDLAYEQRLMAMQGKQGELASMLEEQQAQSLAAAQQKGVPSQK